ncbi:MFS general substrate transporter [Athelia psychrophila]|uniref:MFS general substrate transporter n=1 Tax=Athelia psychrophila TaxID=1759441 RepID=A0A166WHC7_9AGAM|nr:MFS general substrate transporter [Fibularhizoctonia sp. CBS 109695]
MNRSDPQSQQDVLSADPPSAFQGDTSSSISESHNTRKPIQPECEGSSSSVSSIKEYTVEEQERKLVRKLDRRILPILCLLYLFAYLDRTNLGNARLMGLPEDALGGDPTGRLFDWVNSAFFIAYIIFQIPSSVCSKMVSPQIWIAGATVGWGLCSTLMSTTFNFRGLLVARIGLGTFEAGFGPVATLYLTLFYTKNELGLRMAYWFSFSAVAGAFGGLIAFGIQQVHANIANWRLLFIIEGIPTVFLGVLSFFFLPDRPDSTKYLTKEEKKLSAERMNRGTSCDVGATLNKKHIWAAFLDWRIYVAGVIYFGTNCALASISAFLPTIIKTFGYSSALAQLLTVPPYAVAALVMTTTSYISDRAQNRGIFSAGASAVGAIGYIILLSVPDNQHVRYFATFCITSGTYTTIGIVIAWFSHNLGSETKKATGIPIYMSIGQCGSVLGSHLFPSADGPRYLTGFSVSCALELLAALCAIILTISYRLENSRRDSKYGKPDDADARVDMGYLADKAPAFRYVP